MTRLGKRYWPAGTRRGGWRLLRRGPEREFWALRGASFDARPGEVVGIIGSNGAGKSTLFKLLSRITAPSEGEIRIRGRLSALIEVGSGFHPDLTGRENVFLSGTLLGLRRRDIAARLESIAQFSGVGAFLDTPVKWYSSGMYVRLGFAVAAHLEPDILLVDEVLAVGDAEFQARCLRRIHELRLRGTTILFISHDLGTVERLCDRALLLERGALVAEGTPAAVVNTYQRSVSDLPVDVQRAEDRPAPAPVSITGLTLRAAGGGVVDTGDPLAVEIGLSSAAPLADLVAHVMIYGYEDGRLLCRLTADGVAVAPGAQSLRFDVDAIALVPGAYTLGATIAMAGAARPIDWWFGRTTLHVAHGPARQGVFHQPYHWTLVRHAPGTAPSGDAALQRGAGREV